MVLCDFSTGVQPSHKQAALTSLDYVALEMLPFLKT